MKHIFLGILSTSCLCALASTALAEGASETLMIDEANVNVIDIGDPITVSTVEAGGNLSDPNDPAWQALPEFSVEIAPAPAVHESVELRINYDEEPGMAFVTLAQDGENIYVRLRWDDATEDLVTQSNKFRDGAAIEFSLADDETNYMMGTDADDPVNIWYWRSDQEDFQNLAAGGPGSTTMLDDQPVTGGAGYYSTEGGENQWAVVMTRALSATGENEISFDKDQIPVAFAFWQGDQHQRDGLKSATYGWYMADFSN